MREIAKPEFLFFQNPEVLRWFVAMVLLVSAGVVGNQAFQEQSEQYFEQQRVARERVLLSEVIGNIELTPYHFYQTAFLEFKERFQQEYQLSPPIQFEESFFPLWTEKITNVLQEYGFSEVEHESIRLIYRRFRASPVGGFACVGNEESIMLDSKIQSMQQMIGLLSHEIAHLQADHCSSLPDMFVEFPEFQVAFGSRVFLETQAQLLSLEVLAEIAVSDPDPLNRYIAEKAFLERLGNIVQHTELFFTELNNPTGSAERNADVTDHYFYGYLPLAVILSQNSSQPLSLPFLRESSGERGVRNFEFRFFPQLLSEMEIFSA